MPSQPDGVGIVCLVAFQHDLSIKGLKISSLKIRVFKYSAFIRFALA